MITYDIENDLRIDGFSLICGVDEAGRGPLAGDVFAAAVILPEGYIPEELNDSKKLSPKKRDKLFDEIRNNAVSYAIATASVAEIEEHNILEASLLAMRRAIEKLYPKPDFALIDGNIARGFDIPSKAIIDGDALCPSIAAASILAKVARDRYCLEMDALFPMYGFASHKGYGTAKHRKAIEDYGPCPLHRSLFIRKIVKHHE